MSEYTMVLAEFYKLGRDEGGFTKEYKTLVRDKGIVPRNQVEKINDQWKNCGKWYEVFEDETVELYKEGAKRVRAIREAEESKAELGSVLAETIKEAKKSKPKKAKESDKDKESLLDKVEELTGERPHHLTGIAKLEAIIKEHN